MTRGRWHLSTPNVIRSLFSLNRFMNLKMRSLVWTPWPSYNLSSILTTFSYLTRYNYYHLCVWLPQVLKYLPNANPELWIPSKMQMDLPLQLKPSCEVNCHTITSFSKANTECFILLHKDLQDIKEQMAAAMSVRHQLKKYPGPSLVPSTMLSILLMKGVSHKTNYFSVCSLVHYLSSKVRLLGNRYLNTIFCYSLVTHNFSFPHLLRKLFITTANSDLK